MKPVVIAYKPLPAALLARLSEHARVIETPGLSLDNSETLSWLAQAEGIIGSNANVDRQVLDHAPRLKVASTISVGYDNFDVTALTERGVLLMHTPDVLTDTVADTMMALVLATARRIVEVANRTKAGEWTSSIDASWFGCDVHHKTMGIVGMGRIGKALARRAHLGFDMPILYTSRSAHPDAEEKFSAQRCELNELMARADFVCVVLPLTAQTHHFIGEPELALMKPSAILINAGRGPVVDESALISALQRGTIAGAGLDVFEQEPLPVNSPLLQLPHVVALPHIGSATHETRYGMAACAVENLINALTGQVTRYCVNRELLAKTP
ncbi:glyoxylate/hydroxypyruvate reductase GhrB [Cellvibrio polysaccharolyticus]|uniref:Glyoxylate/hydroxypyruvate reductase B n=1 Tax=Cellvibrio polysaccharolyticus TaxID=2082724 RepID=A0A928V5H8_9GAMM|nr:glyoxylate/hydroxypyruvate reductase GhrB [Cellvibrio polysaccharolyticus]MBE8718233.1 glyoxylate/hydroxypyruvate reductase GhrB [Cellvibrio polysaccharolyticus]